MLTVEMSRSETKAQLNQRVEELKRELADSQHRLREGEAAQEDLEEARRDQRRLKAELRDTQHKLEEVTIALEGALEELSTARVSLTCVYILKSTSNVNVIVGNGKGGAGLKWYLTIYRYTEVL